MDDPARQSPPLLAGDRLTLRPGQAADVDALHAIRSEPSVARWWGVPDPPEMIAAALANTGDEVSLVIEVDGEVAGAIQYLEEAEPDHRHAGIDVYLGARWQGRGLGADAVRLLARYLVDVRAHHRLTIDPAADNAGAIRSYESIGFRQVGIMRQYERRSDGAWHDGLLMDLLAAELT